MKATFVRPTIVLDHSNYLRDIQCNPRNIEVCFKSPEAFHEVETSWHLDDFNLVTYHVGCGDETSGKRTFFRASHPVFNAQTLCAKVPVTMITEEDALDSGELSWGTYQHPDYRKRVPTKGHVRVNQDFSGTTMEAAAGEPVDLTRNGTALKNLFQDPNLDTCNIHEPVPDSKDLEFISMNGTVQKNNTDMRRRDLQDLSERGFIDFFVGLYHGIVDFFNVSESTSGYPRIRLSHA